MDPLAALGLAAAVVQFVSFASKIITTVASSDATGAPAELVSLDDVYTTLRDISQKLVHASLAGAKAYKDDCDRTRAATPWMQRQWSFQPSWEQLLDDDDDTNRHAYFPTLQDSYRSLSELSVLCESGCKKIMAIVEKLRASVGTATGQTKEIWTVVTECHEDVDCVVRCLDCVLCAVWETVGGSGQLQGVYHQPHVGPSWHLLDWGSRSNSLSQPRVAMEHAEHSREASVEEE
jgi:hypothetical protein